MSPGNDHDHHRGKRVVFDRKVAQNPAYLYDKDKVEKWSKTIRNYLIGERWEMKAMLEWAEDFQKMEIPEAEIANLRNHSGHGAMSDVGFDPVQANHEIWAFMNLNLQDTKAGNLFD